MKQRKSKQSVNPSQSKYHPEVKLSIGNSDSHTYVVIKSKGAIRFNSLDRINRHKKNIEAFRKLVLPY